MIPARWRRTNTPPDSRPAARTIVIPGYRNYSPGYLAFILAPDGNNIEAVWYDPSKA